MFAKCDKTNVMSNVKKFKDFTFKGKVICTNNQSNICTVKKMTKVRFLLMIFYAVHAKRNGTVSSVLGRHRFE